jgi:hypothetical protein
MPEPVEQSHFSGQLQFIYPDGTVQYNDQIGAPEDFPLTEAEILQITRQFEADPIEPPPEG